MRLWNLWRAFRRQNLEVGPTVSPLAAHNLGDPLTHTTRPRGATATRFAVGLAVLGLLLLLLSTQVCLSTGLRHGLWLDSCPDGNLLQTLTLEANDLVRGAPRAVRLQAIANYTTGRMEEQRTAFLKRFTPQLFLVDGEAHETLLVPKETWSRAGGGLTGAITLPAVPDGDYRLRLKVSSSLGESALELALPLYAPARIHVLTDRPLYEPGNTVKFRALGLKGNDLRPLDGRPGTWRVTNPAGEVLLEEKSPLGPWGVASGSFPLDGAAESGTWTVSWASAGSEQSRSFEVRPFTLPRFRLEATAQRPFYRRGERPVLDGQVRYSSGAPVAGARLEVSYRFSGEWPPPTRWADQTALPRTALADASGGFRLTLPPIPDDLVGTANVALTLAAVDSAGDRVEGSAALLLSQDNLAVSAVTELAGGLVQGLNNRLYLRATTPDGRLLEGVTLNVKRLWEPTDRGTDAEVDVDGVASLQLDPGPAVNVVVPPLPFRPPPRAVPVARTELTDHLNFDGGEAALGDRLAFDRLEPALAGCVPLTHGGEPVRLGVAVSAQGAVLSTGVAQGPVGECVARALKAARFPAGRERLFEVTFAFDDSDLPGLSAELTAVPGGPPGLQEALDEALLEARPCLPAQVASGVLSRLLLWSHDAKSRAVSLRWVEAPRWEEEERISVSAATQACLEGKLKALRLPRLADQEQDIELDASSVGSARLLVEAPQKYEAVRPQATILLGYQFLVSARAGKQELGQTRLFVAPGAVPPLRLRATPQLPRAGDSVNLEVLRGPDFTGELPKKLIISHGFEQREVELSAQTRAATWKVPPEVSGWVRASVADAQVLLFVTPKASLSLTLAPEQARYAPGQLARLTLSTLVDGAPGPAAVGLFGVDDSLAQLAPLPGAAELSELRPKPTFTEAFPGIDAQALALGRVRGANAAAATLLKVSAPPSPIEADSPVAVSGSTHFDPTEALTDHFYAALRELHAQTRAWEGSAPKAEKLVPRTQARLWAAALDALEARNENVRDGYGRRLRLHRLPSELLELTAPQAVVLDGTRMPEDVENWAKFVAREKP